MRVKRCLSSASLHRIVRAPLDVNKPSIVWQSANFFRQFKESASAIELTSQLGVPEAQLFALENRSSGFIDAGLKGRVTLAVVDAHNYDDESSAEDEMTEFFPLYNAFDAYASYGCEGVRRPPKLERLSLAVSTDETATTFYCFFRWGTGNAMCLREAASAQSTSAHQVCTTAILRQFAEGSSLKMQRWHFDLSPKSESDDEESSGDDEHELDHGRLAGRILTPKPSNIQDGHLHFNRFLAETVDIRETTADIILEQTPAACQVFSLPEILSLILVHLPQRELLFNQIVSRAWRSVILSTKEIQEKLFFQPRDKSSWKTEDCEFNPLLYERFPSFFTYSFTSVEDLGPWTDSHWLRTNRWHNRLQDSPYKRPEASWRRMIPCNPAPVECQFVYYYTSWGHKRDWKLKTVTNDHLQTAQPKGFLTFGCLHDILERIWFRREYFPRSNGISVDFGSLSAAEQYREEHDRGLGQFFRHFLRDVQNQFPEVVWDVPGTILVELRYGVGCVQGRLKPDNSKPDEFRIESSREPQFALEIDR